MLKKEPSSGGKKNEVGKIVRENKKKKKMKKKVRKKDGRNSLKREKKMKSNKKGKTTRKKRQTKRSCHCPMFESAIRFTVKFTLLPISDCFLPGYPERINDTSSRID